MATNSDDKQATEKVSATIEIEVPVETWIDFLTKSTDIFKHSYIGYWACGVKHHPERGWLVFEDCDGEYKNKKEPNHDKAVKAWKAGEELPKRWFRLDKAMAIKAYVEGIKLWGIDWFDTKGDASTYDAALQHAMLGELRYS
jgi:hypothetical protein